MKRPLKNFDSESTFEYGIICVWSIYSWLVICIILNELNLVWIVQPEIYLEFQTHLVENMLHQGTQKPCKKRLSKVLGIKVPFHINMVSQSCFFNHMDKYSFRSPYINYRKSLNERKMFK